MIPDVGNSWMEYSFFAAFPRIVVRTLKNPIFLLVVLAQVNLAAMVAGLATFMNKFIEQQFSKAPWLSNMIIGESVVLNSSAAHPAPHALQKRRGS